MVPLQPVKPQIKQKFDCTVFFDIMEKARIKQEDSHNLESIPENRLLNSAREIKAPIIENPKKQFKVLKFRYKSTP